MHILILADPVDNQQEGIHVYTKNLIKALQKIDKKNRYTFIHCKENIFFDSTENYVIKRKKFPGGESFRRFYVIPKLIKKLKPDIVLETAHIGPFRLPETIKRAVIIHDITPILFPQFHTFKSVLIHKVFLKSVLKNSDLILTVSETTKKDIEKNFITKNNIEVIYASGEATKEMTGPQTITSPYILFLGTIEPRKNLKILIEAFEELKKEQKIPHKLILAGKIGWKSKNILKKINKNPDVILTGRITEEEKTKLLKNAEIFVFPSIYEGFGLPPLEAIQHKIPVITSTGGSLKEIYQNYTFQFEPHDKEKLKKLILNLIKNPEEKQKLIEQNQKILPLYSWEKTAEKLLKALEQL